MFIVICSEEFSPDVLANTALLVVPANEAAVIAAVLDTELQLRALLASFLCHLMVLLYL